ncbi:hypothetical protein BEL04_22585 [Mucilaginibacter sp. PPCGB 2223]|uniref:hypothetical protein n=1 Tax=Mucilaginibacter sp. PPCGB 2223 TaxID=1886027 RepID=UPI0008252BFC|nr:hypothetical protein [Mucilaginibacter sp. PPCGB 2223]OCX50566.1 hypothetical protein BEL04_22585 [Mucilaginibacter sp. PPCGB 2223]
MTKIDNILSRLHDALRPVKGEWMIIGTSSLYMAGFSVQPNDIDILADIETTKEIEAALAVYRVETQVRPSEKFRSRFSQYVFDGFNIEVMGGLKVNSFDGWLLLRENIPATEVVFLNQKPFIVPAKESQIAIYTLFDRAKDKSTLQMLTNENLH